MALINWDDQYSVKNEKIDDQHKNLISLVNKLHDAMAGGSGKTILSGILTELIDYTNYHFKTEEDLFDKYDYPEATEHKAAHKELLNTVGDLKLKYDKGEAFVTIKTLNFLNDWVVKHILDMDHQYGDFFRAKGVS